MPGWSTRRGTTEPGWLLSRCLLRGITRTSTKSRAGLAGPAQQGGTNGRGHRCSSDMVSSLDAENPLSPPTKKPAPIPAVSYGPPHRPNARTIKTSGGVRRFGNQAAPVRPALRSRTYGHPPLHDAGTRGHGADSVPYRVPARSVRGWMIWKDAVPVGGVAPASPSESVVSVIERGVPSRQILLDKSP